MPNATIDKMAKETPLSKDKLESLWNRAKEQVNKEYPDVSKEDDKYYALVMTIFKSMVKGTIKKTEESVEFLLKKIYHL